MWLSKHLSHTYEVAGLLSKYDFHNRCGCILIHLYGSILVGLGKIINMYDFSVVSILYIKSLIMMCSFLLLFCFSFFVFLHGILLIYLHAYMWASLLWGSYFDLEFFNHVHWWIRLYSFQVHFKRNLIGLVCFLMERKSSFEGWWKQDNNLWCQLLK